ncbi:MAG TPA: HEPN domain-containing protein [Methanospirillum sp.]|nr:HEPN domain-containing protein [Methanospirillum sp.]
MKPELWLNRADQELLRAQDLLTAGSLLWSVSYAHRAAEYALEGLIFLRTGVRPEKGARIADLRRALTDGLPGPVDKVVSELAELTPLVWQSDPNNPLITTLTEVRARDLFNGVTGIVNLAYDELKIKNGSGEGSAEPI